MSTADALTLRREHPRRARRGRPRQRRDLRRQRRRLQRRDRGARRADPRAAGRDPGRTERWLATSEGAFAYLARDFGLGEIYIWPINEANTGTPQQIRRAIDLIREHDVPVIFSESTVDPRSAQQVARETGIAYGGVLYVDSLSPPDGPVPTYLDLMRVTTGDHRRGADAMSGLVGPRRHRHLPHRPDRARRRDLRSARRLDHRARRRQRLGQVDAVQGDHGLRAAALRARSRSSACRARRRCARNLVAYVPQAEEVDWTFPVLVEDVVMMGRYGHMGWLRRAAPRDRAMVAAALARVGMADLARPPDRRTLRRPEETRLPRPRAGAGGPGDPARRALHRRRRHHRGHHRRPAARNCATRAGSC